MSNCWEWGAGLELQEQIGQGLSSPSSVAELITNGNKLSSESFTWTQMRATAQETLFAKTFFFLQSNNM